MFACLHASGMHSLGALMALASQFSVSIEAAGPATVLFSINGLQRLIGGPQQIASEIMRRGAEKNLHANLAIAANPDTALYAARHLSGVNIIPPGEEARVLGSLPLRELEIPSEMLEALHACGVHTFQQFSLLPPLGVVERFGAEGLRLQDRARGCFRRPLHVSQDKPQFEQQVELEHPLDNLQPLFFMINGALTDLCKQMRLHGVAATEFRLSLQLETTTDERVIPLAMPMTQPAHIFKLLQLHLDAHPPQSVIHGFKLILIPVEPRVEQSGLFSATSPEPASLAITLARIEAIVGTENVGSAQLLDTHRPDAFSTRRFFAQSNATRSASNPIPHTNLVLRIYRPSLAARVLTDGGYPRRVAAAGICGNVTECAGPWRSCGDWWTQQAWARDEWDVSLSDGGLYRIYRAEGWFIAGVYD